MEQTSEMALETSDALSAPNSAPPLRSALQGGDSIEKIWLEIRLQKSLQFWLEIPYRARTRQNVAHEMERN